MRLRVSLPSYKQIEVDINPRKTVKDLKALACSKFGIEPKLTVLLFRGKRLQERSSLTRLAGLDEPIVADYLWARHLILWGLEGQKKIRSASALLAGAGAIGNEVAKNLAMLGLGHILIVDRDRVEMSNISRMIFFADDDLGENKAEALARNLHRKYPFAETVAFRGDLETVPLKFYLDSDVIVCGLDNVVSRIYLTQICRKYSIPMVDGGITGLTGRVHVYIPPNDACPICVFPPNQYAQIVGLRNPCDAPIEQEAVPSAASSISMVSSILSQEAIKIILGWKLFQETSKWPHKTGQPLRSVLFIDLQNNRFSVMELKKGDKCYVCGKEGTAQNPVQRIDIPLQAVRGSKFQQNVKGAVGSLNGSIKIFSETYKGSNIIVDPSRPELRLARGDYLRVLAETEDGELRESILRLT